MGDIPDPHPLAIGFSAAAAEDDQATLDSRARRGKPALEQQLADAPVAHAHGVVAAVDGFALDLHRQRLARRLGQRWRQIDGRAAETRLECPRGDAAANADAKLPVDGASDALRQRLLRKFDAQLTEIRAALTGDADMSVIARDREACRAAEDIAGELCGAEVMLRKRELAVQPIHRRHVSRKLDAVAGERVFARYAIARGLAQRQLEL